MPNGVYLSKDPKNYFSNSVEAPRTETDVRSKAIDRHVAVLVQLPRSLVVHSPCGFIMQGLGIRIFHRSQCKHSWWKR